VPEHDLQAMLATLRVSRRPGSFAYVEDDGHLDPSRSHATIVEAEGRSAVVALDDALGLGLRPAFVAAWLTLDVESALDAVGLTAAVSAALASAGIACNVLAGLRHDHLLVPETQAGLAMQVLAALRGRAPSEDGACDVPERLQPRDPEQARPIVWLRDKTQEGLDAWLPRHTAGYIAERIRAGEDEKTARRTSDAQHAVTFPDGRPAEGHHVMDVVRGDEESGEVVGTLWMGPPFSGDGGTWFVYKVEIDDEFRGRGLGRAAMEAAEAWLRDRGGTKIALNVFGPNVVAGSLYDSLGYQVAATAMYKDL
jgi:hypothetical protein